MAAKAYDKYAQSVLVAEGKPQYAVVTKFSFDQTVKFDSPRFEMIDACDGEQAAAAYARREEARTMLLAAPNFTPVEQPKATTAPEASKAPEGGSKCPYGHAYGTDWGDTPNCKSCRREHKDLEAECAEGGN